MSRPNIKEYHRPSTLEEAWAHVSSGDRSMRILSGGTDLTISAPPEVETLIDVSRVLDDAIERELDGSIRIGAMATFTQLLLSEPLADHATGVVPEMLWDLGNPLLRNISTIGGHLARGKLSDVVPVMVALDASVRLYRGDSQVVPLQRYYDDSMHSSPHLLTDLILPAVSARSAAAFLRFARTSFDFPMLNICCRIDLGGRLVSEARIVCGATPLRSQRATGAESWIREHGLEPRAIATAARRAKDEIRTRDGWVASAEYRSHLVEVLTERCLLEVARRLESS